MINKNRHIIYIGITKTASESIYSSLFYSGLVDNKKHLKGDSHKSYQTNKHILKKHQSIKFIKNNFKKINLDDYFKFTFVRNPYDRHLSLYNWYRKRKPSLVNKNIDLLDFTKKLLVKRKGLDSPPAYRYMTQVAWLRDNNKKIKMEFIGRFERLEDDFEMLCNELDFKSKLNKKNVSKAGNRLKLSDYCPESESLVKEYYEEDFDRLEYSEKLNKE